MPVAAGNGQRPLPALWGAIGNGELAKAPSRPDRDPARYAPHYELAIAKRSAALSVENSLCRDATEQRSQRFGFFVGSTVRRRATDVMESGTAATQAEPIDFAADQPLGPPPATHYQLLPIRQEL